MKDLISLRRLEKAEILSLLDFAAELKEWQHRGTVYQPLAGKTVITSFPPTSLRTRISFETGIYQLGAQAINMPIDFTGKEPVVDRVGYLNCWIDYLVIRQPDEELIQNIADLASFSVVNAMSRKSHPCEILGDLQSLKEVRGDLSGLKLVFLGEGANISNTWFEAAAKLDLNLTQVCPQGYEVAADLYEYARRSSRGEVQVTNDVESGLKGADVILTDGWPVAEGDADYERFLPYQLTLELLQLANRDCIVNPCPPFTRGHEVTDEVIASRHFIGYKAKENLLHMQKAILASLQNKK